MKRSLNYFRAFAVVTVVLVTCLLLFGRWEAHPECWKLTRGEQTLWILGSVHVADSSFYPISPVITAAFSRAEQLYLEVDFNLMDADEAHRAMQSAMAPANKSLSELVTPSSYKKFQAVLQQFHLPEAQFHAYKPWFAVMMLSQLRMQQLGYQPELGIDHHFSQLSVEQHKPIIAFETFSQQMALLAKAEPHQQLIFDETLAQVAEFDSMLQLMMKSWKEGDSATLQQLLLDQSGPAEMQHWLQQTLLVERNLNWVSQLEQQKPRSAFIVVGALHVSGEKGLVNLLKQKGFSASLVN